MKQEPDSRLKLIQGGGRKTADGLSVADAYADVVRTYHAWAFTLTGDNHDENAYARFTAAIVELQRTVMP